MEHVILEEIRELKSLLKSNSPNRWLSLRGVCEYTGLSESTIRRAIRRGSLKVSCTTGKNLFRISWVDKFLGA